MERLVPHIIRRVCPHGALADASVMVIATDVADEGRGGGSGVETRAESPIGMGDTQLPQYVGKAAREFAVVSLGHIRGDKPLVLCQEAYGH
jgi:hypothetical protein